MGLKLRWKRCKECRFEKTFKEFYKTPSGAPRSKCKDCTRAAKRRKYREDHPLVTRNPNRIKQVEARRRKKRIAANRERVKRWRREQPQLFEIQQRQEEKRERERGYPSTAKKRAMLFDAFEEVVDKRTLYELFNGECGICGQKVDYAKVTVDHIRPLSRGGKHCYANCQPAHGHCNRAKSDSLEGELEAA